MAIVERSSKEPTKKQKHDKDNNAKRKSLTSIQKAEICSLKQKEVSQVKLAEKFSVAEATISALQTVMGVILQCKAIQLAERLDVTGFNASDGWLSKFKKWHHIKEYKCLGEAASTPLEELLKFYGASTHGLEEGITLTNVKLKFLLSYTTAHLQLCDAEIIWSFKAHYKKIFCENRIDAFDTCTFLEFGGDPPKPITIKDAIDFTAAAWKKVIPRTIRNCWRKTSILPKDFLNKLFLFEELDQAIEHDITSEIQDLIWRLPFKQPMSAEEYVIADNNLITTELPNDEEIIEAVKNHECIEPEDEAPHKPISFFQALEFINGISLFLEQQPDGSFKVNDFFIQNLSQLKKEVRLKHIASRRQGTLDSFIVGAD
ncbi:4738_t:CDS:2 [Racocetra persica]|uniref:4738_t:CDS:1 n=1 Tax=Racocetra persica TaxID=160502 RepID=A0ACA9L0P6_9GLOM|nr:4738_t:CDS:2 [Racocetra persica]